MSVFTLCPIQAFTYMRGEVVDNKPINMALVTHIKKTRFAWYPDNEGKPSIMFYPSTVEWAFHTEKERDDCYASLTKEMP